MQFSKCISFYVVSKITILFLARREILYLFMRSRDDVGTLHWVVDMFFRRLSNILFFFPTLRYFLHELAVHTLYVTSPRYMLSGVASEYDSVVKSWPTFYWPAWADSKKVYYSLAIPVNYLRANSGYVTPGAYGPSERKFTNVR